MTANFASACVNGEAASLDLPAPNALLFFLSHQDTYRRPLFSGREVFCGPDTETRTEGRILAMRTPAGSFDAGEILAMLPADQSPEIVIVKADATGRNFPRGLDRFNCPRVLLVGDTHHLACPLQKLIQYAGQEPFDFIVLDHTRHHAGWFQEAGFNNVYWIPAVDFGHEARAISATPTRPLTFVGQVGIHHPYRRQVLAQVRAAGLPLEVLTAPLAQTADLYADSHITLNISLNGDLNLRVFEAMAAGGFLLTDELAASSGLPLLFKAGEHLDTWRTAGELIEKIRHYQAHPDAVRRIRTAGQNEIIRFHHPSVKLREFYDLVYSGRVNPRYDLTAVAKFFHLGGLPPAATLLPAYELLQSLHQGAERVEIFGPEELIVALAGIADLPRLKLYGWKALAEQPDETRDPTPADGLAVTQVLWWPGEPDGLAAALAVFRGRHLLAPASAVEVVAKWGYAATGPGLFQFTDPGAWLQSAIQSGVKTFATSRLSALLAQAGRAEDALTIAELAGQAKDDALYQQALQRALFLNRNCFAALLQLASVALKANESASATILLSEAARLAPLAPKIEALRLRLLASYGHLPEIAAHRALTDERLIPAAENPRRILLVTNLFPPEELGGYGRMMWEFAHGLRRRGHDVRVLCGHAPYLRKPPTPEEAAMETSISRELELLGEWREGVARPVGQPARLAQIASANASRVVGAALALDADLVLLGNLDFLGPELLHAALNAEFSVLHALANAGPGYAPGEQPASSRYWVAPCSNWNGAVFCRAGYQAARVETLYPGARLENFFRYFFPDARTLRIAYASLVMPYKGAHVLVDALGRLHRAGISFTAEIAGDSTDPAFLAKLQEFVAANGMSERVRFPGFLDRAGLAELFGRSNVLVFPSQFEEPFGISQVEAMASGLVVVTSGTGGAAEIVRDGIDGLRFPAPDAQALAQRLALLAQNPAKFQELQRNGRRRALDFSVRAAVRGIERRMDALCGEATTAAPGVA